MKSLLFKILRVTIVVLLFVYLMVNYNFDGFLIAVSSISISGILFLLIIGFVQSLCSILGWKILLKHKEIQIPFLKLILLYYVGGFVSLFLPSTIGGDGARVYYIYKITEKLKDNFSIVLYQRITNLQMFLTVFVIPTLVFGDIVKNDLYLYLILGSTILLTILLFLMTDSNISLSKFTLTSRLLKYKVIKNIDAVMREFSIFRRSLQVRFYLYLTSLGFILISLFYRYLIMQMIGMSIDFSYFIQIVIVVTFLTQIPITFSGIGIRENSYVHFFSALGKPPSSSLLFSILEFLPGVFLNTLIGGIYLFILSFKTESNLIDRE